MRLAIIPPLGFERYFPMSDGIQMGLCVGSCINSPWYTTALTEASRRGDYVILDNGAAEGDRCANRVLKETANLINAREIVLPDVIGQRGRTLTDIQTYLKYHSDSTKNYMAVVQGRDFDDLRRFVKDVVDLQVLTLGIPRDLVATITLSARLDLANWIESEFPGRFQIHFLGTNPLWIDEIKQAAKYAGHVRSVDTSAPFVYAGRNLFLGDSDTRKFKNVQRSQGYLKGEFALMYPPLLDRNIQVMKAWAQGKDA
jgi:hypothetical protein